jgi:hypothetical protein
MEIPQAEFGEKRRDGRLAVPPAEIEYFHLVSEAEDLGDVFQPDKGSGAHRFAFTAPRA